MDMEACDLDQVNGEEARHEEEKHGRSPKAGYEYDRSDARAVLTTYSYLTYSTPPPRQQHAIVSAELL
jgi:hypothetical protein